MGPFILAWLVGEGIIVYRASKRPTKGQSTVAAPTQLVPPEPGQLVFSSAVFIMLALLAEVPNARPLAVSLAWGFDIAAWFRLFDKLPMTAAPDNSRGTWPPKKMAPDNVIIPTGGWFQGQARKLTPSSEGGDSGGSTSPGFVTV